MGMIKKSITVTEKQADWIRAQIETGHYGNESEVVRELIRDRQMREQEDTAKLEALRLALIESEQSGLSTLSLDDIWEKARAERKGGNA